jgi:hypothetical protein
MKQDMFQLRNLLEAKRYSFSRATFGMSALDQRLTDGEERERPVHAKSGLLGLNVLVTLIISVTRWHKREPRAFNRGAFTDSNRVGLMAHDERVISELLDALTQALFKKNAASAIAPAPPLELGSDITHNPARLEEWFRTWKGPIISEPVKRTIVVDENVAYAFGLQRMSGTKTDGEQVELWFRATACFRRDDGRWRITHSTTLCPSRWTAVTRHYST